MTDSSDRQTSGYRLSVSDASDARASARAGWDARDLRALRAVQYAAGYAGLARARRRRRSARSSRWLVFARCAARICAGYATRGLRHRDMRMRRQLARARAVQTVQLRQLRARYAYDSTDRSFGDMVRQTAGVTDTDGYRRHGWSDTSDGFGWYGTVRYRRQFARAGCSARAMVPVAGLRARAHAGAQCGRMVRARRSRARSRSSDTRDGLQDMTDRYRPGRDRSDRWMDKRSMPHAGAGTDTEYDGYDTPPRHRDRYRIFTVDTAPVTVG